VYKLIGTGAVLRLTDGAHIPADPANRDRQAYDVWVLEGGVPEREGLEERRRDAWKRIQAERDRRAIGGVLAAGKWFHTDEFSRTQHLGMALMGQNLPAGINWKTMDGSFVPMTPTLVQQIFQAVAASDIAIFAAAEQHRAAMNVAPDPEAYDFSGGWPAVYGE
jgi:hypothetical protein